MGGTFIEEAYDEAEEAVGKIIDNPIGGTAEVIGKGVGKAAEGFGVGMAGDQPSGGAAPTPSEDLEGPSDAEVAKEAKADNDLADRARMKAKRSVGGSKAGNILSSAPNPDDEEDEMSLARNVLLGA